MVGGCAWDAFAIVHLLAARPILSSPRLALNAVPLTPGTSTRVAERDRRLMLDGHPQRRVDPLRCRGQVVLDDAPQ